MNRKKWKEERARLEGKNLKRRVLNSYTSENLDPFGFVIKMVRLIVEFLRLDKFLMLTTTKIKITRNEFKPKKLLTSKKPLRILHLTDFHLEENLHLIPYLHDKASQVEDIDLIFLTGDYADLPENYQEVIPHLKSILDRFPCKNIYAVLGNHDPHTIVPLLEDIGIKVLVNESDAIEVNGRELLITGLDDIHYFYTDQVPEALKAQKRDYNLLLVHSPEVYDLAANNGYDHYFCGHTHGGQVSLPFNFPLITRCNRGRFFFRRAWKYKEMHGYTSMGIGTSGLKLRIFTSAEFAIHEIYG